MLLRKYSKDNREILYELKGVMPCSFLIFSFVDDYSLYRFETVSYFLFLSLETKRCDVLFVFVYLVGCKLAIGFAKCFLLVHVTWIRVECYSTERLTKETIWHIGIKLAKIKVHWVKQSGNYCVFPEYHKCVLLHITWMVGSAN